MNLLVTVALLMGSMSTERMQECANFEELESQVLDGMMSVVGAAPEQPLEGIPGVSVLEADAGDGSTRLLVTSQSARGAVQVVLTCRRPGEGARLTCTSSGLARTAYVTAEEVKVLKRGQTMGEVIERLCPTPVVLRPGGGATTLRYYQRVRAQKFQEMFVDLEFDRSARLVRTNRYFE